MLSKKQILKCWKLLKKFNSPIWQTAWPWVPSKPRIILMSLLSFSKSHLLFMTTTWRSFRFQEGYGSRIKGLHFFNAPSFVDRIVAMAKSSLKPKLASRVSWRKPKVSSKLFIFLRFLSTRFMTTNIVLNSERIFELFFILTGNEFLYFCKTNGKFSSQRFGHCCFINRYTFIWQIPIRCTTSFQNQYYPLTTAVINPPWTNCRVSMNIFHAPM